MLNYYLFHPSIHRPKRLSSSGSWTSCGAYLSCLGQYAADTLKWLPANCRVCISPSQSQWHVYDSSITCGFLLLIPTVFANLPLNKSDVHLEASHGVSTGNKSSAVSMRWKIVFGLFNGSHISSTKPSGGLTNDTYMPAVFRYKLMSIKSMCHFVF